MKKVISLFAAFMFVLSMCPAVFAAEPTSFVADPQSLYAQYEEIIAEANETYGCSLFLTPFEEMKDFCSVEEFRESVINYCENRNEPFVSLIGPMSGNTAERGSGVVTVPCTRTKTYPQDTVTVTFYGTFEVRTNTSGYYYIASQSFSVYTGSANGKIYFTTQGNPSVRTVDGGRTIMVTQQFNVYVEGRFGETTSLTATYIMNFANGNITASN